MHPVIDRSQVDAVLAEFPDPETGRPLGVMGQVRDVEVRGASIAVTIALTTYSAPLWSETQQTLADRLRAALPGASDIAVEVVEHRRPPEPIGQIGLRAKSVIAVGSGKGGVGKSTVAASLAIALKNSGARVGLLD